MGDHFTAAGQVGFAADSDTIRRLHAYAAHHRMTIHEAVRACVLATLARHEQETP